MSLEEGENRYPRERLAHHLTSVLTELKKETDLFESLYFLTQTASKPLYGIMGAIPIIRNDNKDVFIELNTQFSLFSH